MGEHIPIAKFSLHLQQSWQRTEKVKSEEEEESERQAGGEKGDVVR